MKVWNVTLAACVAAALVGCGSGEVDPNPYEMKGVASGPAAEGGDGGGSSAPGGYMASGYPGLKSAMAEKGKGDAADAAKGGEAKEVAPATDAAKADDSVTLTADEIKEIESLPEGERAVALKQKVCPISEEHLGSMGKPIKVMAGEQTVFLCCDGCVKGFEADPDAALAKLGLKK